MLVEAKKDSKGQLFDAVEADTKKAVEKDAIRITFNQDYRFAPNTPKDNTVLRFYKDKTYDVDKKFDGIVKKGIATGSKVGAS